jgi:hypothetical protein
MAANKPQQPGALKLIFDLTRNEFDSQLKASAEVDTKIFQSFTAACLLIGLATVREATVHVHGRGALVPIIVAVLAFLVNAGLSINALWSRSYRVPISARQLVARYWYDTPDVTMEAFVHDVANGHDENDKHHTDKHRALRRGLVALLIEAAAIGASLIVANL